MAATHGKNTVVTVDGTDISAWTKEAELTFDTDTHDTTAFGDDSKTFVPGLREGSFSCSGWYDTTASGGTRDVFVGAVEGNAAVAVVHQPEGAGTGKPQNSFNGIIASYSEEAAVDDIVMWSADITVTGDVDTTAQS